MVVVIATTANHHLSRGPRILREQRCWTHRRHWGAGYIGSHFVHSLTALGYHVIVIDNGSHAPQTLRKLLDTKCCHLIAADIRNETATRSAYLDAHERVEYGAKNAWSTTQNMNRHQ